MVSRARRAQSISPGILHPEVQRKAQSITDEVVEPGRLPIFVDRSKLQYIDFIALILLFKKRFVGVRSHLSAFRIEILRMMITRDTLYQQVHSYMRMREL